MSDPTDMVAWLNAVLDRREQAAADIESVGLGNLLPAAIIDGTGATVYFTPEAYARIVAALSPDAMRRAVAVKRKILAMHCTVELENEEGYQIGEGCAECNHFTEYGACDTVRVLAEEFASEPGYQEAWRR